MNLKNNSIRRAFAFILIATTIFGTSAKVNAMQGIQTSTMRLGIGLASLATKECKGYKLGPGADKMFDILKANTEEAKTRVLALAEEEAKRFLKAQGKDICDVASGMTGDRGMLQKI